MSDLMFGPGKIEVDDERRRERRKAKRAQMLAIVYVECMHDNTKKVNTVLRISR